MTVIQYHCTWCQSIGHTRVLFLISTVPMAKSCIASEIKQGTLVSNTHSFFIHLSYSTPWTKWLRIFWHCFIQPSQISSHVTDVNRFWKKTTGYSQHYGQTHRQKTVPKNCINRMKHFKYTSKQFGLLFNPNGTCMI